MREAIKIGVIADQTGALSIMGGAQANVATLVVDEINASGGLLGRRVELLIEDSATDDGQAAAAATRLVQDDHVAVLLGGIFSSTRQAIKEPALCRSMSRFGGSSSCFRSAWAGFTRYQPLDEPELGAFE